MTERIINLEVNEKGSWRRVTSFKIEAGERPRMFDMLDRCQMHRVGKHTAGRLLDGRTWDGHPS